MTRGEKLALGGAAAGHILLFGALSLGWMTPRPPADLKVSQPIDISLAEVVALDSSAPEATEAPAQSVAPDEGAPADAAPPEESAPEPEPLPAPAPPAPAPPAEPAPAPKAKPKPAPAPRPVPKPVPPKPQPKAAPKAPAKAAPKAEQKAPAKAAPKAAPARPAASAAKAKAAPAKGNGSDSAATATRARGSRLGADFRKSLANAEQPGRGETPRAANVGAQSVAGLASAIARQVQPCANRITNPGPGANRIRSRINLQMSPNGSLTARPRLLGQSGLDDENTRYAQRVFELASAAIIQCAPFELPDELYEGGWKNITINYKLPG